MAITATALNQALQALSDCGGGVYTLPKGQYQIDQTVIIPEGVVIRGEYFTMPFGTRRFPLSTAGSVNNLLSFQVGTCFNVTTTAPAVQLVGDMSGVEGITFYYPNQSETSPTFYAPTIVVDSPTQMYLMGCQIRNVLLVNSYSGIEAGRGNSMIGQLSIEGVRGQPLTAGITIDKCVDVCRIKDVHFWAFWSGIAYVFMCQMNAVALRLYRSDWQVVDDFFCYGYSIGIQFAINELGQVTNGLFNNIQVDASGLAIDLYAISEVGCMFSNCNFVSTLSPFNGDPRFSHGVTLPIWAHPTGRADSAKSTLMLQNCSFFGDLSTAVAWEYPGKLFVSTSRFAATTGQNFYITNGNVKAIGCHFESLNTANSRLQVI